jgi:signal transduction histidine kinase
VIFDRIEADNEILGTVHLRTDHAMPQRVRHYLGIAAVVILAAMAVALALSSRLQRVVTVPVLDIASIAREVVEQGDYSRRARKRSDDEVGSLADAFNAMLAETERRTGALEESNAALGRLVRERQVAEEEVLRLNAELEDRVRERTAELEATNNELEAFAFSVSHDLRAPLRSIDGFSQALLEDFPKDVPEEAQRYLARIRAATLRMGQLIEDLLNLSRVSRGALQREEVDLGAIARQVVADLRAREPEREVEVTVWDDLQVRADPRLLRAALENLLGNAWKFTGKAAHARIEVGVVRDGQREVYFVRDNGAGFSMEYANKLFAPFQRLHAASEFAGTGIGLATVQRIVYRHGGRVWAHAKVGQGATFHFTLQPEATREEPAFLVGDRGARATGAPDEHADAPSPTRTP